MMSFKFWWWKCFCSIWKIHDDLGRMNMIFGMYVARAFDWCIVCSFLEILLDLRRLVGRRRRPELSSGVSATVLGFSWGGFHVRACLSNWLAVLALTRATLCLTDDVVCHVINETHRFIDAYWMLIVLLACVIDWIPCFDSACVCIDWLSGTLMSFNKTVRFDF